MMKSRHTEYEGWEAGLIDLPSRSRLYSLAPIGIGTAQAECLTSYVMRLAAAHCLSLGTLYKQEIYPLIIAEAADLYKQPPYRSLKVTSNIRDARCWNGAERSASNLARALECLTCVPGLHLLTWLPWEAVLSRQFLLRRQRAWCPECLSQWQDKDQAIYEPLLWTLQAVSICPIHDCALMKICPCCRRNLEALSANARAGHCSQCQQWLGRSVEDQRSFAGIRGSIQLHEQRWIAESIGELVARAPGLSNSLSPISIDENVEDLINRLIKGDGPNVADLIGVRKKIVSFWHGGRRIPRLEFILKLCYRLDLSVADFLTAMIGRLNCGTQIEETQLQNLKVPAKRKAVAAWEANVRRVLEASLLEEPPPSPPEIAERLGYASTRPLYDKYGELFRRIVARYRMTIGRQVSIQPPPDKKQPFLLRQLLEQELSKESPCHPRNLARRTGYKCFDTAERQCSELWQALLGKHRERREEEKARRHERERKMITSALSEDPMPTMDEIVRRLGYRSKPNLSKRFPDECSAIRKKRDRRREERLEELEAKLRAVLSEEPPRPLTQVAASLHRDRSELYRRWRELCHAITARHAGYRRERARKKRLALKEQVRQIVLELHQHGLHPSKERIIPLLHNPPNSCFVTLNEILKEIRKELNLPTL